MCECGHGVELYFTVVVVVPSHAAEKIQIGAHLHTPRGTRRHSYFFFGAMKERVAIFQHRSLLLEN